MKAFCYETCCVHADGDDINEMRDDDRMLDVTYETMLRNCRGLLEWAQDHGYELRENIGSGLTLRNDWSVGYHKSFYQGRRCYYLVWSAIEWIWTEC